MGCGSSLADRAIGLDGHDNVKQYVIEKNKQVFLQNYIKQINQNTSSNIKRLKQKKIGEIQQHQNQARKYIQQLKAHINKRQPGSIAKAEALHKKSSQQLLGLNQTLKVLQGQKSIVNSRYEEQQRQILRQIRQQYEKIYDSINPSTSKLQHINGLPQDDRLKAFKWGDKYAQKQIAIHNKSLKQELDKKFVFSNFQHRFDSIVPKKNLQDILEDGKQRANRTTVKDSSCATC